MATREALFQCQECGKKFYTVASAERASNNGCPKCGGVDVDFYLQPRQQGLEEGKETPLTRSVYRHFTR